MLDLIITNGRVADGTGNPLRRADIAIADGRIAGVGKFPTAAARQTYDATGKIVCPGFVDPHSHSDRTLPVNPVADSTIRQGVTTEIVGNCGMTLAPVTDHSLGATAATLTQFGYEGDVNWRTFGEHLALVEEVGTSQNLGWLVGHNTIRRAAGVASGAPSPEQLEEMKRHVDEAMTSGALGMSTGLEFKPGNAASTEELVDLNKVVGGYEGIYASHVRNRDARLRESTIEFLQIVEEGGTRGEYSHLNVRHNTGAAPDAWQETVDMLAAARERGLEVLADTTPFNDGLGRMAALLPPWLTDNPNAEVARLLDEPDMRNRLREECDRYWRFIHKGEWDRVRLVGSPQNPELDGKDFTEIAAIKGGDPWDAFFDILRDAGERYGDIQMVGRLFTDEHLAEMISHPLLSLGVDGMSSSTVGPLAGIIRHPVSYCGHVHYLTHHVRDRGTLSLEEAIRKMTSMPATQFGLWDRGLVKTGFAADVVVFDYESLEDESTLADPVRYVRGVDLVLVNGVETVRGGEHTGARAGQTLRTTS